MFALCEEETEEWLERKKNKKMGKETEELLKRKKNEKPLSIRWRRGSYMGPKLY